MRDIQQLYKTLNQQLCETENQQLYETENYSCEKRNKIQIPVWNKQLAVVPNEEPTAVRENSINRAQNTELCEAVC